MSEKSKVLHYKQKFKIMYKCTSVCSLYLSTAW